MKNIKKIKIDGVEYGLIPKVKDENGYLLVDNDGIYIDFEALKLALEVGSQTLPDKIKTIEDTLKELLKADETLSSQFTASLEKKQNVIEDLENIRSGATKGATALQEIPEEYVTERELALMNFLTEHQSLEHLATKEEVRDIENKIPSLGGYATEQWVNEQDFLTEHQSLEHLATKEQLENKVDKVDGKQLSTEDFTTILKTKLEALKNYDDSALISRIDAIQDNIDTLFNKDVSSAIESFNEIVAFLNGIEDSEDLDSIIASIEQQIAKKQEKISDLETIRSGAALGATAIQKVKTINGQSIEGEGDITINVNTEEIYEIIESNEKVTAAALNDLNERKANTDYVDNAIASAITNTLNTEV